MFKKVTQLFTAITLSGSLLLLLGSSLTFVQGQTPLPDLAVELLVITPTHPFVGQSTTITMRIRNTGPLTVSGRRAYLYIDPAEQPPTVNTPATRELIVVGITWPPGDAMLGSLEEITFDTPGEHVIYGWVDPLERITESNEINNLQMLTVTVRAVVDSYEPDDTCPQASLIATDGQTQTHTFHTVDDVDWVQFPVTHGTIYTITALNIGSESRANIALWDECDMPITFDEPQSQFLYTPANTGEVNLRISNQIVAANPAETTYHLSVEAGPTYPDLAVESLTLTPPQPEVGQPTNITMRIRNTGPLTVAGRRAYLYIDPAEQPPTVNTPATRELIVNGIVWPPGDAMTATLEGFIFDTSGDHAIYGWVDPLERITEYNELNNLRQMRVTVGSRTPSLIYLPFIVKPPPLPFEIPY